MLLCSKKFHFVVGVPMESIWEIKSNKMNKFTAANINEKTLSNIMFVYFFFYGLTKKTLEYIFTDT